MRFLKKNSMPKPAHPWHQNHRGEWEDAKMPKPAHEWHNHNDEHEDAFQEEGCNDPR